MNKKIFILAFFLIYSISYSIEFSHFITFDGHKSSIGCITFSHDSKYLASGSFDATIKIWDINNKKIKNNIKYGDIVESIAFSKDNSLLVSAGRDKYVKFWDIKTGNLAQTYGPFNDFLFCVEFSPDNKNVLIGSYKYVYFLDVKKNKIIYKLDIGNIWARCIRFSPDNNYLGVCGGNEVIIYNFKPGINFINKILGKNMEIKKIISKKITQYIYSMDFSYDSQFFAFGSEQGEIYLYRTIDGLFFWNKKIFNSIIWSVSFSSYNKLAVAGRDKDIVIFDIKNGGITNIIPATSNEIFSISFSKNGKYLASSGKDAKINIWQIKDTNNFIFKIKYLYISAIFIIAFLILLRLFNRKSSVKDWKP